MNGAGREPFADRAARGLSAELRRVRGDPVPWVFLPLALLAAGSVLASLPDGIRSAPPDAVRALGEVLGASAAAGLLMIAAVLGGLAVALADRGGVLARGQLFHDLGVVLAARGLSTLLVTGVFGGVGAGAANAVFLAATGGVLLPLPVLAGVVLAAGAAGVWGHLLGILVRSPLIVMFVVPLTLSPGALLADAAPAIAAVLPLQALVAAAGLSTDGALGGGPGGGSGGGMAPLAAIGVTSIWLVALTTVVVIATRHRDRL